MYPVTFTSELVSLIEPLLHYNHILLTLHFCTTTDPFKLIHHHEMERVTTLTLLPEYSREPAATLTTLQTIIPLLHALRTEVTIFF